MKRMIKDIFLKLMFNILNSYMNFINIQKVKMLVPNLLDKVEYVIDIRKSKQASNHELVLKKLDRIIKFKQQACLKSYTDIITGLQKKQKNDFEKDFSQLMNNSVFGKTIKDVRKQRDFKLFTTERRRNCLLSEPNYHTVKFFTNVCWLQK